MIEILLSIGVILIAAGLRFLYVKFQASETVKNATEAVILAVQHVQLTYTEAIKKAREDGKLTDEEAKEAKQLAMAKAMELAKGPALSLLTAWGKDKVGAIVELALSKLKSK